MILPDLRSSMPGSTNRVQQEDAAQVDGDHAVPLGDLEVGEVVLAEYAPRR